MSWNGSDLRGKGVTTPQCTSTSRPAWGVIIAALVILAVVVVLISWMTSSSTAKPTQMRDRADNLSPSGQSHTPLQDVMSSRKTTTSRDTLIESTTEGEAWTAASAAVKMAEKTVVNDGSLRPRDPYEVLKLNCDKQIATLIFAEPGQMIIGSVDFGEDFENQFKESLASKLVPSEDATDEERDIIAAVNEAKEILVKSMREERKTAGEILAETREQLRELWDYKSLLKTEITRFENDEEKTDEDVSDLFDAANKILKENNMPPFEPNDLTREVIRQSKFDQLENEEENN